MAFNRLIRSISLATLASGMIYPYYLLFLKNLGNSYAAYGLAFAVFTISSALTSQGLSKWVDRYGIQLMGGSAIGMACAMLVFPWVNSLLWVLVLQLIMGSCNAMQRMSERLLLADLTEHGSRGVNLGNYHFWTSIASGFAVLAGGYLIDWLTIDVLFYASALLYGFSAWAVLRRRVQE